MFYSKDTWEQWIWDYHVINDRDHREFLIYLCNLSFNKLSILSPINKPNKDQRFKWKLNFKQEYRIVIYYTRQCIWLSGNWFLNFFILWHIVFEMSDSNATKLCITLKIEMTIFYISSDNIRSYRSSTRLCKKQIFVEDHIFHLTYYWLP